MKKTSILLSIACVGMYCSVAPVAANDEKGRLAATPKQFVEGAVEASQLEVRAGELAQQKGTSPAVRKLGQTLVEDQRKIKDQLRKVAQAYNVQLDQKLSAEHAEEWQRLRTASGAEFDRAFLNQIIADHERDLSMLQEVLARWDDKEEITALIEQNVLMVRRHLEMAEAARRNIRAEDSTAARVEKAPGKETLGFPTSKQDGTILGVIPAPSSEVEAGANESYIAEELADGQVDENVEDVFDADREAVQAPATYEREKAASRFVTEEDSRAQAEERSTETDRRKSYIAEELTDGKVDEGVDNILEADREAVGAPATSEREKAAGKVVPDQDNP